MGISHAELVSREQQQRMLPRKILLVFLAASFSVLPLSPSWSKELFGYIDKQGNWVVKPQFQFGYDFKNGQADVSVFENGSIVRKTIDMKGAFVKKPETKGSSESPRDEYSEGLRPVCIYERQKDRHTYVYEDKTGKVVIAPEVDWAGQFHDGLAAVNIGRDWYFIDKSGKKVISLPDTVSRVGNFYRGIAPVAIGGNPDPPGWVTSPRSGAKWGFIDRQGKVVVNPTFEDYGFGPEFHEDRAAVRIDIGNGFQAFGYVDEHGKLVIPPKFQTAEGFSEGLALVGVAPVGFQSDLWKTSPSDRLHQLHEFFRQNKLVGSSPQDVRSFFGSPDYSPGTTINQENTPLAASNRDSYIIIPASGKQSAFWMDIEYKNNKVYRFRITDSNTDDQVWLYDNNYVL
jgi:hypothetical protein